MTDEWMRPALAALIDGVDDADARRALTDPIAFAAVRAQVESDRSVGVPGGERGENLMTALIALRVKFPLDEARAKLETNLAMRSPSPRPVGNAR